jgi:hypothetical protein
VCALSGPFAELMRVFADYFAGALRSSKPPFRARTQRAFFAFGDSDNFHSTYEKTPHKSGF